MTLKEKITAYLTLKYGRPPTSAEWDKELNGVGLIMIEEAIKRAEKFKEFLLTR